MNTTAEKTRAEFALELDRQRQQLLREANGNGFSVAHVAALLLPLLLVAFAILKEDLSSAEQFIASTAGMGLVSLYMAVLTDANRRTRALLRLLDRNTDE